jgi:hypothetical protein
MSAIVESIGIGRLLVPVVVADKRASSCPEPSNGSRPSSRRTGEPTVTGTNALVRSPVTRTSPFTATGRV